MIQMKNIQKFFGTFHALKNINLDIQQGEIFGLIGSSGAGKSTLLRMINGLEQADDGELWVQKQRLDCLGTKQLRCMRQDIGMIFQQFNLFDQKNVAENIAFPLKISGMDKQAINIRVDECLSIVGLEERKFHFPSQLSGGQKQRVGIARALAPKPSIILADEPTSALDPQTTRSVLSCLRDIHQTFGVTIVLVTHEIPVLSHICHRAAVMAQGEILEVLNIKENGIKANSLAGQQLLQEISL